MMSRRYEDNSEIQSDDFEAREFFEAIRAGDMTKVSALLNTDLRFLQILNNNNSPLDCAIYNQQVPIARLLLDRDTNGMMKLDGYGIAMRSACENDNVPALQLLISRGGEINWIDDNGIGSLLQSCMQYGSINCFRVLLRAGAEVNFDVETAYCHIDDGISQQDFVDALNE